MRRVLGHTAGRRTVCTKNNLLLEHGIFLDEISQGDRHANIYVLCPFFSHHLYHVRHVGATLLRIIAGR